MPIDTDTQTSNRIQSLQIAFYGAAPWLKPSPAA